MNKKNSQLIFSIITPVFNTEKYLVRSILSVINQKFQKVELILIDDGSNDKSGEICKKFSKNFNFIKFVKNNKNKGVSKSRNLGLKIAKGCTDHFGVLLAVGISFNFILSLKFKFTLFWLR